MTTENLLLRFVERATSYRNKADDFTYVELKAILEAVVRDTDIYEKDAKLTIQYFESMYLVMKNSIKDCDLIVFYKAIQAACTNESGLSLLQSCSRLCQLLFSKLPDSWSLDSSFCDQTSLKGLLNVLAKISVDYRFTWFKISLEQVLGRLSGMLLWYEDRAEVAALSLASLVHLCRANPLGVREGQAMHAKMLMKSLLPMCSNEAFNASSVSFLTREDEPPVHFPLMVSHLLLLLEEVLPPVLDKELIERLSISSKVLLDALRSSESNTAGQAADFLADLVGSEKRRELLVSVADHDSTIVAISESLDAANLEPECRRSVLTLLGSLLELVPSENLQDLAVPSALLNVCVADLTTSTNWLASADVVRVNQMKMLSACLRLTSSTLARCEGLREDLREGVSTLATTLVGLLTELMDLGREQLTKPECLANLTEVLTILKTLRHESSVLELECEPMMVLTDGLAKGGVPGHSAAVVACLSLVSGLTEVAAHWGHLKKELLASPEVCTHLALALDLGGAETRLRATEVVAKLPQESRQMVQADLALMNAPPTPSSAPQLETLSEGQSEILDSLIERVQHSLDSQDSGICQEPDGLDVTAVVQLSELKVRDLRAQLEVLQTCLDASNSLAQQRLQLVTKAENERMELLSQLMGSVKRSHVASVSNKHLQKKLKGSQETIQGMKQELGKQHQLLMSAQREGQLLSAQLQEERESNAGKSKLNLKLEADKQALEVKLGVYKKELSSLNHNNKSLLKDCETKDQNIKSLLADKEKMTAELADLRRIKEMVAMLTTGKADPKKSLASL